MKKEVLKSKKVVESILSENVENIRDSVQAALAEKIAQRLEEARRSSDYVGTVDFSDKEQLDRFNKMKKHIQTAMRGKSPDSNNRHYDSKRGKIPIDIMGRDHTDLGKEKRTRTNSVRGTPDTAKRGDVYVRDNAWRGGVTSAQVKMAKRLLKKALSKNT